MTYTEWVLGGKPIGGMMALPERSVDVSISRTLVRRYSRAGFKARGAHPGSRF